MQTLDNIIGTTIRLFKIGFCAALVATIASLLIWPEDAGRALLVIATWRSLLVPKIGAAVVIVMYRRPIARLLYRKVLRRGFFFLMDLVFFLTGSTDVPSECIEDVPRVEILDHLFRNGTLLRDEAEVAFRLPRYRVTALKQNLERVGVLVRGPNNAHVLNPEFSRADVASVLESSSTAAGLQPLFRKRPDGTFTSNPTAIETKERVEAAIENESATPLLSKAPGFQIALLAT